MGLFEIGAVGLPLAVISVIVMLAVTPLLLPSRRAPSESVDEDAREFTVEMEVTADGTVAGRSVAEGGLRSLRACTWWRWSAQTATGSPRCARTRSCRPATG